MEELGIQVERHEVWEELSLKPPALSLYVSTRSPLPFLLGCIGSVNALHMLCLWRGRSCVGSRKLAQLTDWCSWWLMGWLKFGLAHSHVFSVLDAWPSGCDGLDLLLGDVQWCS